jgi:hypothetical protein
MHRMIRGPAALGLATAAALALGLGTATAAGAGVTGPVTYTTTTAGYQVRGAQAVNDVRTTVVFPSPAVEVVDAVPLDGVQASFSRVGLTRLLDPASPSSPTRQLTLAAESLAEFMGTQTGEARHRATTRSW